jgi:DNA polymerase
MDRLNLGASGFTSTGDIAAVVAWWREAGVDCAFVDEPVTWLAAPEPDVAATADRPAPATKAIAPPPRVRIGGPAEAWPQEQADFAGWWLSEPSLDSGRVAGRVPPRGMHGAALMVLVEQPEAGDSDVLLSGPQGHLIDAMLSAMGVAPDQVYRASVLTRHTPMPDWAGLAADGIGEILAHHLKLAAPARVISFGNNILSLLGHDPAQMTANLHSFNQEGGSIPVLGAPGLDAMTRARAKAGFWQRWLEWTGTPVS